MVYGVLARALKMRLVMCLMDCSVIAKLWASMDIDYHTNIVMDNNEVFIKENVDKEEDMDENIILSVFLISLSIR